jgi:hypothetical protein
MEVLIIRPSQFADRVRAYKLEIDGKPAGVIKAGQEITLNIPENAQQLLAKIDWCTSNKFDLTGIRDNEKLEIKNAMALKLLIPFYIFYAITFGKNKYLKIERSAVF